MDLNGFQAVSVLFELESGLRHGQDCNVYVAEVSAGLALKPLSVAKDRQAYLLCIEGDVKCQGQAMQRHDAAEIKGPATQAAFRRGFEPFSIVFNRFHMFSL